MVELPLTKEEVELLEKQEKQLKIIIEDLKTIQTGHFKIIVQYKSRLQLQKAAKTVIDALKNQAT